MVGVTWRQLPNRITRAWIFHREQQHSKSCLTAVPSMTQPMQPRRSLRQLLDTSSVSSSIKLAAAVCGMLLLTAIVTVMVQNSSMLATQDT
jgi:hypothetical protein